MNRLYLSILLLSLSACAASPHHHLIGEGVVCPHRSHGVSAPEPIEEVVYTSRARYDDGLSRFVDERSGAAVYEGDIGFALQGAERTPSDPEALDLDEAATAAK